ncbi:MAG: BspA family leucine-rich repeat surface protein [Clostridia bacterium]|nr:BspA family leucine-rich repeat surface protein [Clostridia bacterium]
MAFLINSRINNPISVNRIHIYHPVHPTELSNIIEDLINKGIVDLNCIDTSNMISMYGAFSNIDIPKEMQERLDVSEWNVSNVEDMSKAFENLEYFNGDLSNWDVSNVRYMTYTFSYCKSFEGKGLENWNITDKLQILDSTFNNCYKFNADISNWDVHNVSVFKETFLKCIEFNQPIGKWNIENGVNLTRMMQYCSIFNQDLTNWRLNLNVIRNRMFTGCNSMEKINYPAWYINNL